MKKIFLLTLILISALYSFSQQPSGGTLITSPIRPNDLLDLYPTAFANEIKGGHHQVADTLARNNIYMERRDTGMLCTVLDDGFGRVKTYQLLGGISNSNWIQFSSGGSGNLYPGTGLTITNDTLNFSYGNGLAINGNLVEANLGNGLEFNGSSISIDYGTGLNIIAGEIVARNSESLWNSNQLQGIGITTTLPSTDQILTYNGTNWTPSSAASLLTGGDGIIISNDTINVDYGSGLSLLANQLVSDIGNGLEFNGNTIQADIGSGLIFNGSDIQANLGNGLNFNGNLIQANLGNGLEFNAGSIQADLGIGLAYNGVEIIIDFGAGLNSFGNQVIARTNEALWNANNLQSVGISTNVPVNNNILFYNGIEWTPGSASNFFSGGDGIFISNDTIEVDYGNGLTISGNKLITNIGSGLEFNGDTIQADLGTGLVFNGSNITADLGDGLNINGNSIQANLGNGLEFNLGGITIDYGIGLNITGSEIVARTGDPIWNADKLQSVSISTAIPTDRQVLSFTGINWAPGSVGDLLFASEGINISTDTIKVDYGSGLTISGNQLIANLGNGLEFSGDSIQADLGAGLEYNGSNIQADIGPGLTFNSNDIVVDFGTGLNISGTQLVARNTEALWNANQLQGTGISSSAPANNNILSFNGSEWTPNSAGNLLTGGNGINISNDTIEVDYGNGLSISSNKLVANIGKGLAFNGDTIQVSLGTGLEFNGYVIRTDIGNGLDISGNDIVAKISSGLEFIAGAITINEGTGLNKNIAGEVVARTNEALWNANQLQGVGISTSIPTTGEILTYNGTTWSPSVPASPLIDGDGINIQNDTVSVDYGAGLSILSNKLIVNIGNGLAFNGDTIQTKLGTGLEFNGSNIRADLGNGLSISGNDITTNIGSGLEFIAGAITINEGTGLNINIAGEVVARTNEALWNANELQGAGISTSIPSIGEILTYNGTTWSPALPSTPLSGGVGINILNDTINADYGIGLGISANKLIALIDSPFWNANELRGISVSTISPIIGQTLIFNGAAWVPSTPIVYTAGGGMDITGNTISVDYGKGLILLSSQLIPNLGNGLEFNGALIQADLGDGMEFDGSNIRPKLGNGLEFNGTLLQADLGDGLEFDGSNIRPKLGNGLEFNGTLVQADLGNGMTFDGSNITTNLGYGLTFSGNKIVVDFSTGLDTISGKLIAKNSIALWNADKLQGIQISTTSPTNGQVLTYSGGNWMPGPQNSYSAGSGINITSNTISVEYGNGFTIISNQLIPNLGNGLELNGSVIQADLGKGLEFDGSNIRALLGNGLEFNGNFIQADLGIGLSFDGSNIQVTETSIESFIENDINDNYIPYNNGTKLVGSSIYYDGTDIGIGTISPNNKLSVAGNISVGNIAAGTNANRTLVLENGNLPTTRPANVVQLYAKDYIDGDGTSTSELFVLDEDGNETNLSPHNFSLIEKSEPMAWAFYSRNYKTEQEINVDMLRVIRLIEQLTGENLVNIYSFDGQTVRKEIEKPEILSNKLTRLEKENKELKSKLEVLNTRIENLENK